jgi:hypothetical protein
MTKNLGFKKKKKTSSTTNLNTLQFVMWLQSIWGQKTKKQKSNMWYLLVRCKKHLWFCNWHFHEIIANNNSTYTIFITFTTLYLKNYDILFGFQWTNMIVKLGKIFKIQIVYIFLMNKKYQFQSKFKVQNFIL